MLQLITAACAAEGESAVPQKLDIHIGNSIFGAWHVVLRGRSLTCTQERAGRADQNALPVTPTDEQWRAFRNALDGLAVFQWQPDYPNHGVMDGTQWRVDIAYPDRAVKAKGDNNFPDAHGKPNLDPRWTSTFQAFVNALKKLLGEGSLFPDAGEQSRERSNKAMQLTVTRCATTFFMMKTLPLRLTRPIGSRS
jgi:hypothetical protein